MSDLRQKLFSLIDQSPQPIKENPEPIELIKKQILDGLQSQKDLYGLMEKVIEYLANESKDPDFKYQGIRILNEKYGIYNSYTNQKESNPSLFGENIYKR